MKVAPVVLALTACVGIGAVAIHYNRAASNLPGVYLDALDVSKFDQDTLVAQRCASFRHQPIMLSGVEYKHGIGTRAPSTLRIELHGAATRFVAVVGVDDAAAAEGVRPGMVKGGAANFLFAVDGRPVIETGVLRDGGKPRLISIDLRGAQTIDLRTLSGDANAGADNTDYADARIITDHPEAIKAVRIASDPPRMAYVPTPATPVIHGPRVIGTTHGRPFLFRVPATGQGPLRYYAFGLPEGLSIDHLSGVVSGSVHHTARASVRLSVSGPKGRASRDLLIIAEPHSLAQTPPMGWSSWNVWADTVDQGKVEEAADMLLSSGLAAHGYSFVNVDDSWAGSRDANGNIRANAKFPDVAALANSLHTKGLKLGIYSSPGPLTCEKYTGSYGHEQQDAATFARWGVDYLKYDWCSYGEAVRGAGIQYYEAPYAKMRAGLDSAGRDIVYSVCEYGLGSVHTWAGKNPVAANAWRTQTDLTDRWLSLRRTYEAQAGLAGYAGPGHWNDPDMLQVGVVGFGVTHPARLTPNEQITHVSLWCLLAAPLIIGCDLGKLDPFTLAILTNDEAIDIDQDPLGIAADRVAADGDQEIWARPLFDGSRAVGLVNAADDPKQITVEWRALGIGQRQKVRDVWLHKDIGVLASSYTVLVPAHGTVLLRVTKAS